MGSTEPESRVERGRGRPELDARMHALLLSVHLSDPVDDVGDTVDAITRAGTEILGFGLATLLLARPDGLLEVTSVSGRHPRARAALSGEVVPLRLVRRPGTVVRRLGEFELTDRDEPTAPPDRWQPPAYLLGSRVGETLQAPLFDSDGEVVAVLRMDDPPDGLLPDDGLLLLLDLLAVQTGIVVRGHLERRRLQQEVDLAQLGQEVLAQAAGSPDLDTLLSAVGPLLQKGMAAQRLSIRLTGDHGDLPERSLVGGDELLGPLPDSVVTILAAAAERLWSQQRARVVVVEHPQPDLLPGVDVAALLGAIEARGIGSALLAPIGAATTCYGYLLLLRGKGEPIWTEPERQAAQTIARGLGTAVLNASLADRERDFLERLRTVDEHKRALFATISHEFQGPLSSIVGHAELLEDGMDADLAELSVSSIARNAARLQAMIADLMVLQQVEAQETRPLPRPVDLVAATRDALDVFAMNAERAGVQLVFDASVERVQAWGDRVELGRVVANLVGNAVKYSGPDTTVRVGLEDRGDVVRFRCTDQGIGISAEDQERLFEQFYRGSAPEVRRERGTGLGLSIVKRIVDRHDGAISVDSAPGRGSTFVVDLPAAPVSN